MGIFFKRYLFALTICVVLLLLAAGTLAGKVVMTMLTNPAATPVIRPAISTTHQFASETPIAQGWQQGAKLVIPAIHVNAPIESVGLQANGNMDVPTQNQWTGVGWFKFGTFPGHQGSAVIDGHLDRPGGSPAVFWKLKQLHVGDTLQIENPGAKTLRFRVQDMEYYSPNDAPLAKIFTDHTGTYLNLVTCAGNWIPARHETTLRLVVYTKLV